MQIEQATAILKDRFPILGRALLTQDAQVIIDIAKEVLANEAPVEDKRVPILSKVRKQRGMTYGGEASGVFAEFGKNAEGKKTIRMTGQYANSDVDITFAEGDTAEYDSYNFSYLGVITSIGAKTVTIAPSLGALTKRLDLNEFMWRNHNFNLEKLAAERAAWSD